MRKLLVSDFDKTLFTKDYEQNIRYINEFVARGNMFAIATGRNNYDLQRDIKDFKINFNYLICNDGAAIYNHHNELINSTDIPKDIAVKVVDKIITSNLFSSWCIDKTDGFSQNFNDKINRIVAIPIDHNQAQAILDKLTLENPLIRGYYSDTHLNITSHQVNKGNGVKFIQDIEKIDQNDIYTIGDNINDIPMLKNYHGFVMKNNTINKNHLSYQEYNSVYELIKDIEKIV